MREVDLYPPVKQFLSQQGYEVKGEVRDCDVIAVRGDEPSVVVELKLTFNLTVVLQAVDRLQISEVVYIGVPQGLAVLRRHRKKVIKLARMLGLGLGKGSAWGAQQPDGGKSYENKGSDPFHTGSLTENVGGVGIFELSTSAQPDILMPQFRGTIEPCKPFPQPGRSSPRGAAQRFLFG